MPCGGLGRLLRGWRLDGQPWLGGSKKPCLICMRKLRLQPETGRVIMKDKCDRGKLEFIFKPSKRRKMRWPDSSPLREQVHKDIYTEPYQLAKHSRLRPCRGIQHSSEVISSQKTLGHLSYKQEYTRLPSPTRHSASWPCGSRGTLLRISSPPLETSLTGAPASDSNSYQMT